jgi:acetyl-CoA acyltransferase
MFSKLGINKKREPVLVDYCRTALGKKNGSFQGRVRGDDLMIHVVKAIVARNKSVEKDIGDLICGCNSQIGTCALDIGRTVSLAAGLPWTVPGVSINRQCASGMQCCYFAWQEIATGAADVVLAGGIESQNEYPIMADMNVGNETIPPNKGISMSPYVMESSKKYNGVISGQINSAEIMGRVWNEKTGMTYEAFRKELDELSLYSHQKAAKTYAQRAKEIIPMKVPKLGENGKPILDENYNMIEGQTDIADKDESIRANSTLEKLQSLPGIVSRKKPYLTAANSCPTTDGAAVTLWTTRGYAEEHGLKIRSTLESCFVCGTDPVLMLTGPIDAVPGALKKAELKLDDMDFIEINEAFSTVVKASTYELKFDWKDKRLNQYGGAIAIGHPTGCTGARLLGTMTHMMEDSGKKYGIGSLCVGLGMGIAGIMKREGA